MKYFQLFIGILFLAGSIQAQNKNILTELRTIELPDVKARIDHMFIDPESERLFIAALGNGSIEVIDLKSGKDIHSISKLEEPQGVLYYSNTKLLFVSSGEDGTCKIFGSPDFKLLKTIKIGSDADNIRFDKKRNIIFIGFGSGGIAAVNPVTMQLLYKIELPAHPESFQLDEKNGRIFINVPDKHQLDVIDIDGKKVIQKINLTVSGNFPMALDTINQVVFIGSRNPPRLVLYNANSLSKISENDISGDADDIFYDEKDSLIFVSEGAGSIDVFRQVNSKQIISVEKIKSSPGARTSLYFPELNKLFVAAPEHNGKNAKLIEYSINP